MAFTWTASYNGITVTMETIAVIPTWDRDFGVGMIERMLQEWSTGHASGSRLAFLHPNVTITGTTGPMPAYHLVPYIGEQGTWNAMVLDTRRDYEASAGVDLDNYAADFVAAQDAWRTRAADPADGTILPGWTPGY